MGGCCCCNREKFLLRVNVIRAEGIGKYDVFGSVDPFVILEYEGKKKKTKYIANNQAPHWDEVLEFENERLGGVLHLTLMDHDKITANDFIGNVALTKELPTEYNKIKDIEVAVKDDKRNLETGKVYLKVEFVRK